jgi:hypothetical protein
MTPERHSHDLPELSQRCDFRSSTPQAASTTMEAENCSVCLNDLADEPGDCSKLIASLEPCKHAFHDGCIQTWLKTFSSCPICRRKVEAVRVSNEVGGG